jgi:hypothetical protein
MREELRKRAGLGKVIPDERPVKETELFGKIVNKRTIETVRHPGSKILSQARLHHPLLGIAGHDHEGLALSGVPFPAVFLLHKPAM